MASIRDRLNAEKRKEETRIWGKPQTSSGVTERIQKSKQEEEAKINPLTQHKANLGNGRGNFGGGRESTLEGESPFGRGLVGDYLHDFFPEDGKDFAKRMGYAAERSAAGLLGAGESVTDFLGTGLYTGLEKVAGLAGPNKVSEWAGKAADKFVDNSISQAYRENIDQRYNPSIGEEKRGDLNETAAQMAAAIASGKALSGMAGTGSKLMSEADKARRAANFGKAAFGLQAAGGGMNEAYAEGASRGQALGYGVSVGAMETAIESIAGGIPGLGTGVASQILQRVTSNPLVSGFLDTLGEGAEEALSTIIMPFIKRAFYDADAKTATLEEIAESAVLGMVLSGLIQVGTGVGSMVMDSRSQETTIPAPEGVDANDPLWQMAVEATQEPQEVLSDEVGVDTTPSQNVAEAEQQAQQSREEELAAPEPRAEETPKAQAQEKATEKAPKTARDGRLEQTGKETTPTDNAAQEAKSEAGEGQKDDLAERMTKAAYDAGREGVPREGVELVTKAQEEAYQAGRMDQITKAGEKAGKPAGKKKIPRTKKSDWSSDDVHWTLPGDVKRPIAYSTKAASDLIEVLADENPAATIRELQGLIRYDQEAKRVLQQYIDAGYGDQVANEWFSADKRTGHKRPTTQWTTGAMEPPVEKGASQDYTGKEETNTRMTEQEGITNGRTETVSDPGHAESAGGIGEADTDAKGSRRSRYESRIKEILRKHAATSRRNRERSARVERKETRDDFEDRMRADGYFYAETKHGGAAMGFKPAPEESWSNEAKAAQETLAKWGFEVIIFAGEMHTNRKGISEVSTAGQTLRDGRDITIFLSSDLDIDGMETAYHEALHAIRTGPNVLHRVKIENIILDNIDVDSAEFESFVTRIADLYAYAVQDVSEERFAAEIIEEFYAWYVGKLHAADAGVWGREIDAFSDAETVKAEIDAIYAKMEVSSNGLEDDHGDEGSPRSAESNHAESERGNDSSGRTGGTSGAVREPARDRSGRDGVLPERGKSSGLTPQRSIAEDVLKYLRNGQDFTAARLFEIADKHFGGTMAEGKYTVKDAYDGMELAVNLYLVEADFVKKGNGNQAGARVTLKRLVEMLKHIPTQTKRTAEQESFQQFSTPPNIAYLAAWAANVNASDVVLEPSAGIGGLALWPKAWGATVYGNELSERRLAFLNELGLDGTFNHNAEQIDNLLPESIKPSVVIMNPPFSATAGRTSKNDTANAKRHIQQALDRLQEGGRLVAILGNGMADDAPAFKGWWNELRQENSIRANIRLDGENYRKYGTTFDVQLVVIDKTGPQMGATITGTFKDLAQVPGMMEVIRNDRTRETGSRGVLPDSNSVAVRDSAQQNGAQRDRDTERSAGTASDARGRGKQSGKAGKRNPSERDGRADGRGDSGSDVRGVRGRSGDQETVRSGAEELGKGSAGPRMALSGRAEPDLDGKSSAVTENPDSVYATYTPKKVHIAGAKKHPARLVESAAMAAVEPPDVTYTPHLPAKIAQDGILSDAQLENVVYAGQAHSQKLADGRRKGYFIGDGTGVGKGRQLAGIIMDNFMQGRKKAVWISASTELINDAKRDWKDLGGKAEDILDMKGNKLIKNGIQADSGILFGAYSTLANAQNKEKRFKMLRDWLGEDFDGVIALDEAHKMGNSVAIKKARGKSKPSQQALTGIELQKAFPNARIVYASATGATDISQYGYLERLGLWGPGTAFNDLNDFIAKISNGGLAAMELVARDMKSMGVYMARSISYDDVSYDTLQHDLNPMQTEIYNTMSRAWQTVFQNMQEALKVTGGDKNGKARGAVNSKFYGTQQRFYDQIITSMSMPTVIEDIRKELANGRSCVIQLVNTNEAQANRALSKLEDEGLSLDDLDLTPSEMLADMVRSAYPIQEYEEYTDERGNTQTRPVVDGDGNPVLSKKAIRMRDALLEDLKNMKVPDGPLEMLIDAFGVDNVAEVTGRSQRVVEKPDANGRMTRTVERRNSSTAGTADSKMFQDGKKRILIFSQAGGTGFSYHADLRAKNQQQRVHYLLQAGWSASDAVQGFGRTHRSNQKSAPIVRLVTTNVMGQKRFTSTIARRLDQLGALTKGQRQAGSGVFSEKDNLENPIAADALATYYKTIDRGVLRKLGLYDNLIDEFGRIKDSAEDLRNVSKFLNRILSLEVEEQNEVFQGFYDTFDRMMDIAIANGTVDMGLENYRADKIEVKDEKVIRKDKSGADTKYVQMQIYNKPELVSLAKAKGRYQNFQGIVRTEDGSVRAVYEISSKTDPKTGEIQRRFKLEGPVKGKTSVFVESTLKKQTTPVDKADWAQAWKDETAKAPKYNESTLHLLTGTLLPIWDRLPANNTRVMRVLSSDGKQYLGRVIRADEIDSVLKGLGANRTMQTYTPSQVSNAVLGQGKEVVFRDNKLRLTRRRVSGEWRMELTGQNVWYLGRSFPGLITERINYEYRYFVPTGDGGEAILDTLMKQNPVVDIRDSAPSGEVDHMLNGAAVDHSGEWTAKRVGNANKTPMRLSELLEHIRHEFGLNITSGHIRGAGVRGQYDRRNQGVRSKIAQDLPTIAHELGHHLDDSYGLSDGLSKEMKQELLNNLDPALAASYTKKERIREGIAEYVRRFLQNRETAAIDYPLFTDYFLGMFTGKDLALIEQLADEVNAYYALDADTATSSIRFREEGAADARTVMEKLKAKASVLAQAWLDSNQGIKEFDRATGANTYKLATNAAYSDAMAGQIIVGDLTDANGQYVAPGLKAALQGLNLNDKEEYRLFGEYLAVKHGPERLAEGMRIFADDRKNSTAFMQRRAAELEAQYPQFEEVAKRLYVFQRQFLQTWGVDTGLVSSVTALEWHKRWKYYVPLNRAVSKDKRGIGARRGFANQDSTIKRAHGSGLDIVHPVDNIVNNLVKMVNAGVRNNVMRAITDQATAIGANATFLEQVPTPLVKRSFDMTGVKEDLHEQLWNSGMDPASLNTADQIVANLDDILDQYGRGKAHGDVITVMKGGDQEFWKINDPLLLSSLTHMSQKNMEGILDAYAVVSRFMTSNITGNNIVWSLFSNFPRDMMTLFTYSKTKNPAKVFAGLGSAYLNKAKGDNADPLYKEYLAMGGGKTSAYTADRDLAKKARKALAGKKFSANPLDWITFVSDAVELGPRYATYKLMRQAGMKPQEAFYEAMDITVNFRKGGQVAREANKVIPFFNASVQGLDKFRRWITAEDAAGKAERKKVVMARGITYIAVSGALAALFYAINNGDDEKEKEYQQLSNYTKNSFWNVPLGDGKYFAIPKPRELGVLSSFFETCMEYGVGENDHAFDEFYSYATENFLPSVASDITQVGENGLVETGMGIIGSFGIVGVVGYLGANRDFLGRPIVSSGLQSLEKKDQYTDRTSKIAYWLGQAFNASPTQIDYFFQQVLGGWWKAQKALFPVGKENVDYTLGVRNTYVKDNQYSTDLVNWMYDQADISSRAKKSDPSDLNKAITAKMDGNMTTFYSRYYKLAKNQRETTATRAARQTVLDMISEYRKATDTGSLTAAQRAVYSLCEAVGNTDNLPAVMKAEVKDGNGRKHTLSDIQYVEYQTEYNRLYWENVEANLADATGTAEKNAVLTAAKAVAKEQATNRVLARIGATQTKYTTEFEGVSTNDVITYKAQRDLANDDGSLKQEEVIDIIGLMVEEGLSFEDAYTLFHSEYESDKNNPWKGYKK